jgi:hypothetical protein
MFWKVEAVNRSSNCNPGGQAVWFEISLPVVQRKFTSMLYLVPADGGVLSVIANTTPQPPPAEEQHNIHQVAKGAALGAAFGAAAGTTGGGETTVMHTGSAHRSGSAHHEAKPIKPVQSNPHTRCT